MNLERWQQIDQLFQHAVDVEAADRDSWLCAACAGDPELLAEVRSLIDVYAAQSTDPFAGAVEHAMASLDALAVPRRVGPYELIEELGRGGMGAVYKGRRVDNEYDATVAIKLVRGGDAASILQRFRRERQILARLTHPSIARLLDGGTTDRGIPYIVMEYIDGVAITDYCQRRQLSVRERLALFLPVCAAADYAHGAFIVHRDIKPGNILIDATGTPKLLDFGVSKLLAGDESELDATLTQGLVPLTPHYASPEQITGEPVSARSDVYALGAVLYELLTGARAHRLDRLTPTAIEEVICRQDVPLPSKAAKDRRVARRLAGDLDNILMRALQKDPARRYDSAAALADDITRYLNNLPVAARADSAGYRARKFVRRHRGLVIATLSVIAALTVGLVAAIQQTRIAQARELQVRDLAKVFLFDVYDSVRELPGATSARKTIVETAVQYLDALAASRPDDPALLRELASGYVRVGEIQGNNARGANLGQPTAALASYRKALAIYDALAGGSRHGDGDTSIVVDQLTTRLQIAELEARTDGLRPAIATLTAAAMRGRMLLRRYPQDQRLRQLVPEVLMALCRREREGGDLARALASGTEALSILDALDREFPGHADTILGVASAESAVGMAHVRLGNLHQGLDHYQRAVAYSRQLLDRDPLNVNIRRNLMIAYSHVGDVLGHPALPNLGDSDGAERAYRQVAALAHQLHDEDVADRRGQTDYAIALARLAAVIPDGRADEKQAEFERSLAMLQRLCATGSDRQPQIFLAGSELSLGALLHDRGQITPAAAHLRRAIAVSESLLATGDTTVLRNLVRAYGVLARVEAKAQHRGVAFALLRKALSLVDESQKRAAALDDGINLLVARPRVYSALAAVHYQFGETAEGVEWQQRAIASWRALADKPDFTPVFRDEMAATVALRRLRQ